MDREQFEKSADLCEKIILLLEKSFPDFGKDAESVMATLEMSVAAAMQGMTADDEYNVNTFCKNVEYFIKKGNEIGNA